MKWCLFKIPYDREPVGPAFHLMLVVLVLTAIILFWEC